MNVGQNAPTASKKTPDPSDNSAKKPDRKGDTSTDEPKPRIVLTFRSEKPGAKSSNMKIVSSEEKVEEVSPRRSNRARVAKYDSEDDNEVSPKKDKGHVIEADESGSSTLKRSTRGRSKDADNTPTTSKKEPPTVPTRLSRRIKPTAKVLENEELRIGVESQNNARLGLSEKTSPEDGVRTRRSVRSKDSKSSEDVSTVVEKEKKSANSKAVETVEKDNADPNEVLKLKHLCELGLKARSPEELDEMNGGDDEADAEETEELEIEGEEGESEAEDQDEDHEIDDDSEVITKLLEDDDESDEEFSSRSRARPRRSQHHRCRELSESNSLPDEPRRRSTRKRTRIYEEQWDDGVCNMLKASPKRHRGAECDDTVIGSPAGGDEGSEATQPDDEDAIIADCTCEEPSNLYAAPDDDTTAPIFCQALESVDGVRVGCSHGARRQSDGARAALLRCGPRAPFIRVCPLHREMMTSHMCCTTCALFCTQGIFYQCSKKHLFHLECGLLSVYEKKQPPGCPHCGFKRNQRRTPVNVQCVKVRVDMHCSNKRVFMQDQREQCATAYLGFTPVTTLDESPVIPADLLPSPPIDLKQLCQKPVSEGDEGVEGALDELYESIMAGHTVEQLIPNIMSYPNLNAPLPSMNGGTLMHAAAKRGNLSAVYVLHVAGADLNATTATQHTPVQCAVLALLEKPDTKMTKKKISTDKDPEEMEADESEAINKEEDSKISSAARASETARGTDEELMKVIRYLVAAGCDVNSNGPDGMTALHMAAQYGGTAVCEMLLCGNALVDPRDHGGWTPLVWAAENCHTDTVSLLIKHGADATATDNEGNGAVHWCALSGAARVLHLLLNAAPAAVHAVNAHTDTPLHVAARQGHYACVVILLARGARTDVENSAGELPVEVCAGPCQSAISLNMQMTLSRPNARRKLLKGDISRGREPHPIPCVNEIDDAVLPDDFTYVTKNVMPTNIVIDNSLQTMQGCACADGDGDCSSVECACVSLSVRRWTRAPGAQGEGARLRANFPHHDPPMLFTCNATCGCNAKKCTNMGLAGVSAQGSVFVRTEVYRVGGSRGWGLRAIAKIPRGTLVATYCGELVTMADADTRSNDQYMFALDVKPDLLEQCAEKTQLCIDANVYGGAARFINHSCKPNLASVRVFTDCRDLRLPHAQLFATRPVHPMDQLTFDYGDKFWSVKSKYMKCECGEPDCRYPAVKGESDTEVPDK